MQIVSGIILLFSIVGLLVSGVIVFGAAHFWFVFFRTQLRAWIERRKRSRGVA